MLLQFNTSFFLFSFWIIYLDLSIDGGVINKFIVYMILVPSKTSHQIYSLFLITFYGVCDNHIDSTT